MSGEKKGYYCPFDLQPINMNNLAYELVFNESFNYRTAKYDDTFKALTTVDGESLIELSTDRREYVFGFEEEPCLIVLENYEFEGESTVSGLSFLIENVELNSKAEIKDVPMENKSAGNYDLQMPDSDFLDQDGNVNTKKIGPNKKRGFRIKINPEKYNLVEAKVNSEGNYEFFNKCRQRVMTALPCCPHCHMRLPKGWGEAEDFFIVSLIGPARIGKTMMRLSLMADQWKALVRNVQINGSLVNIMPAHYIGYGGFYDEIIEMAEQLSNDGICPHPIDRNKLIQPLFLNVVYKGHRMIVGIYDIASYKPDKPFELWNRYLKYAIDNSDADLFLFDPMDMDIELLRARIDPVSIKEGEACESAEDYFIEGEIKKRPLDMYHVMNFQRYGRRAVPDKKSSRHFRGVIVKSDLLQPIVDEGKYGILFRDTFEDPSDRDGVLTTNEIIKDMIKEYRLFGNLSDDEIDDIGSNYKKARRSWHCISALGCNQDMCGKLEGDYAPIRVAEPIIRCIVDRIADNGWIEEKH